MRFFSSAAGVLLGGVVSCVSAGPIDYGPMQIAGRLTDERVNESSGLAASRTHPDHFWTHNDSGDAPRLFLITARGAVKAELPVDVPRAIDWEDMCSFELDGTPYLLVGDVGDNGHKRERVTLWLIPEPALEFDPDGGVKKIPGAGVPIRKIDFTYADGPRDCESIGFDPTSRTVVIVTKVDPRRPPVGQAGVYLLPLPPPEDEDADGDELHVLERAADLTLRVTTAMDVAPDGRRCVIATYGDAWQYVRDGDETWADAFAKPPTQVALGPRGQSETIAYGGDGKTLMMTAEGVGKPVWRVSPKAKRGDE